MAQFEMYPDYSYLKNKKEYILPKNIPKGKVKEILMFIAQWGAVDGAHHKQWVLDQVVKIALGHDEKRYTEWVMMHNRGEDGPNTYSWDEGIAP